jgi:DNA-binding response OmpR family regulator
MIKLALFLRSKGMKTIFIVEDETGIRDALQLLLSFENYDVRSFATVDAFNKRDKSVNPDIFILDVMLPDGLGTDLCNQLKKDAETSHIPVMIISAHAKAENVVASCEADEFIPKPFDIDDVLLKIEKLIN